MQVSIVIDLHEGLERNAELAAVIEHPVMMVRNTPWPGIEIQALVESTDLFVSAEFGVFIATAQCPVTTACACVVFKHLDRIARLAQLISRDQASQTRAEDKNGATPCALQRGRPAIGRFRGKAEVVHGLVHQGAATCDADHAQ
jgi:hypothetical protein